MRKKWLDILDDWVKWAMAVMLLLVSVHASAEIIFGEYGDDEEEKPREYKVLPVKLPAFPDEEKLLPFEIGPTQTQSFFIDPESISVSPDEIRYTMVTKSNAGAKNVSYEGVRCGTFEFRRYAYGHRNGKWVMSKNEDWRLINFHATNRPRAVLVQEFFCDGKAIAGSAEDMIFRIRYNRPIIRNNYTGSSYSY